MSLRAAGKSLLKNLLPPILHAALRRGQAQPPAPPADRTGLADAFYAGLVPAGGLCFDIGANSGNRLAVFRRLGFPVVAVEPQTRCHQALHAAFGRDSGVTLLRKAVGRTPGRATLMISDTDVLSTLSTEFIDATTRSGRFEGVTWDKTEQVEVTTLDALIGEYGDPAFIKVDVEGFELEVVMGLNRPVKLIALEWTPELTENSLGCIEHLARLGPVSFNLSWGESMRLARRRWLTEAEIKALLDQFREETYLFADIYVRSGTP